MVLRLTVFSTVATSFSRKLPSPLSSSSVRPDRAEEPLPLIEEPLIEEAPIEEPPIEEPPIEEPPIEEPPIEEPPIEEDMELPLSGVIFSSGSFS